MSYPPIRYDGPGEINAQLRRASEPPEVTTPAGGAFRYLATGSGTDGLFGLYEVRLVPGAGTTPHFHRTISEAFYVLSGELQVHDGQDWTAVGVGDYLHVPAGGLHGFRNDSADPMTMLMLFTPGAPREEYFERVAELAELTEEQRTEFFVKHDTYFVDPAAGPSTGD